MFSHYPGPPLPVEADVPVLGEEPCPYRPGRLSRYRAFVTEWMPGALYHRFMDAGFRRSGEFFYQPVCRGCRACVPIRVPVDAFTPSRTQRRALKRNQDLERTVAEPSFTPEKHDLYRRYTQQWHGRADAPDENDFAGFLASSPVDTIEFSYRDSHGRLLAVGVCDVCAQSLSSVYFYFDPEHAQRWLGTYGALQEIAWAREKKIPYYYLGYWVEDCAAMSYKNAFRPYELLGTDGAWKKVE